ncbi:MAG: hypothetical protein Q9205_003337 [Flavoplaca limonia]
MWLINAHTWKLEEVWSEEVKTYAILSHRWQEEEVSFKDMQNITMASKKQGFSKIKNSCDLALRDGYDYVWVDTCCINKESSAELSEAINSMFRWYKSAAICYAYLSDVDINNFNGTSVEDQLQQSQWFTRGWTLQELLAPNDVVFYDCTWLALGTKRTLSKVIQRRTRIHEQALHGEPLETYSIAQRMSWASQRVTTRSEDIAYCLLGIFDVNMPILYGEGTKAFLRLQEEIIKQSDDHSIFAWPIDDREQTGLLADNPAAFASCQDVRVLNSRGGHSSYAITNRGIWCDFVATPFVVDTYLVRLDCTADELQSWKGTVFAPLHLGMFLRRLDDDDQYARVRISGQTFVRTDAIYWVHNRKLAIPGKSIETIDSIQVNIRQKILGVHTKLQKTRFNGFRLSFDETTLQSISHGSSISVDGGAWDPVDMTMEFKPASYNHMGTLGLYRLRGSIADLKIGFDLWYNPLCLVQAKSMFGDEEYAMACGRRSRDLEIVKPAWSFLNMMAFNVDGWSQSNDLGYVADVDGNPGFWALKGDRLDGLRAQRLFKRYSSPFSYSGKDGASIAIEREETEDSLIWVVYLDCNTLSED